MRHIWSEEYKRILMRRVWVALASAQNYAGLVTADQLADLKKEVKNLNIDRSLEIERESHHDVMAELRTYAEQCPIGAAVLHLGATSTDITDNVDVLRMREASTLLIQRLSGLLATFVDLVEETAGDPILAINHIQSSHTAGKPPAIHQTNWHPDSSPGISAMHELHQHPPHASSPRYRPE